MEEPLRGQQPFPTQKPPHTNQPTVLYWKQPILLKMQGFLRHGDSTEQNTIKCPFLWMGPLGLQGPRPKLKGAATLFFLFQSPTSALFDIEEERYEIKLIRVNIFPDTFLQDLDTYFSTYISKTIFALSLNKCPSHERLSIHVNSVHYWFILFYFI